jgi:ComF family protein
MAWSRHEIYDFNFDLVLAVPLTPRRLRKRGFNQAFFIASGSAAVLDLPLAYNLLLKTIDTPQQASLNRRARTRNLSSDLFLVPKPEKIRGKNILLCDDVLTTGTTLSVAAKVLKDAGANSVSAFTLARVLL